jgi:hypothetical protein
VICCHRDKYSLTPAFFLFHLFSYNLTFWELIGKHEAVLKWVDSDNESYFATVSHHQWDGDGEVKYSPAELHNLVLLLQNAQCLTLLWLFDSEIIPHF